MRRSARLRCRFGHSGPHRSLYDVQRRDLSVQPVDLAAGLEALPGQLRLCGLGSLGKLGVLGLDLLQPTPRTEDARPALVRLVGWAHRLAHHCISPARGRPTAHPSIEIR